MKSADSFAALSFREVTHHVFCSTVIAVPAAVAVKVLKNVESIKRYGADGGVIGCCVMENLVDPTDIGAVRRCTLRLPNYRDKLIREKLTHYAEHRNPNLGDASNVREGDLTQMEMTLDYVPCEVAECSRSPFEAIVEAAIHRTCTHIRVAAVTRSPHRCVVEMDAECVLRLHEGRHVSAEAKLQDKACERAVTEFWQHYLDAQLLALERQVVKEAYPEVRTQLEVDLRTAYASHEEVLCEWAVETQDSIPRHVAVEELEKVLVWWARALEAYKQEKTRTEIAEARIGKAEPAGFSLTGPLPRRFTEAEKSAAPTRRISEATVHAGTAAYDVHNLSECTQASQSGMDVPMPGFLLPRTFADTPESPGAFLRSSSRGPATIYSDTGRQSVLMPPDRRYTAVPKKSLASATTLPEGGAPVRAPSPASSFLAASNAAATSSSNLLQASVLSHGSRRKQMTAQQPHLLQHAQRRLSNMNNNLSNSVSRQSAASTSVVRPAPSNATGLFFSQFFAPPAPAAAATGTASSSSPSRSTNPPAAGAATHPSHASHNTTSTASAAAAAAADALEPFQPDMVRQLFSLTGVLRKDVARRVFLSLSSQDGAAPPRLSADGLKSVLRHLDPCGLREGGALNRGTAAAACDDAYRAEVQRCYHEQSANASPSGRANAAAAAGRRSAGSDDSPQDESSKLSRLAARREASRREGDEVALEKLVQSVLSRFAFQKKRELSYEEFQLALLHLWGN